MKKKIPFAILEALQPVVNDNLDLVKTVKGSNSMFHLVDKDENSDFYFKVTKQEARSGVLNYLIEYKPKSREKFKSARCLGYLRSSLYDNQKVAGTTSSI